MHIEVELDDIHSERLLKLQQRLNKPLTEIAAEFLLAQGDGLFQLFMIGETEFPKMAALMHKYADLPMDLADTSLILLAEHLGHGRIISTDRRDFHLPLERPLSVCQFIGKFIGYSPYFSIVSLNFYPLHDPKNSPSPNQFSGR